MKWVNVFGFCHTIIKMTIMMTINIILLTFFLKALKDFEVFIIKIAVILTFCVPVLSLQELQIVSITVLQVGYYQFLTFVLIYQCNLGKVKHYALSLHSMSLRYLLTGYSRSCSGQLSVLEISFNKATKSFSQI